MNISFGKKIPITQTQILNKKTGTFEKATVFELECTDESDLVETMKPKDKWIYAKSINQNMLTKYIQLKHGEENDSSFYVLENKDGETLGMAETKELLNGNHNLSLFDTKKEKEYKYVGQTLLASISKTLLERGCRRFSIFDPMPFAFSFYEKTCGFPNYRNLYFSADINELNQFIKQTEQRTQAPIINLEG